MTTKSVPFCIWMAACLLTILFVTAATAEAQTAPPNGSNQAAADVRGIWSGTLYSKHANAAPFTITMEINAGGRGYLIGTSSLRSDCLHGTKLQVTVTSTKVVLAGSDEEGDNITVRGTLDATGTRMKSTYILNGSASGRCESDDGVGDLAKR